MSTTPVVFDDAYCLPFGVNQGDLCLRTEQSKPSFCNTATSNGYLDVSAEEMKSLCASEPTCVGYTREPANGKFKPKDWIQTSYSAPGYKCTLLVDDASGVRYESIGTNAACLSEDAPNGGDLTDYLPCDLSCAIKRCNAEPLCVGLSGTGNGAYKLKSVIDGTSPGSYGQCIRKIGSSNGAASDGAASDGAASDGAASDGAASDGAVSDGAASDGPVAGGGDQPPQSSSAVQGKKGDSGKSFPVLTVVAGALGGLALIGLLAYIYSRRRNTADVSATPLDSNVSGENMLE
jgi:hypothetical protein